MSLVQQLATGDLHHDTLRLVLVALLTVFVVLAILAAMDGEP